MSITVKASKEVMIGLFGREFDRMECDVKEGRITWLNRWGANVYPTGVADEYSVSGHHAGEAEYTVEKIKQAVHLSRFSADEINEMMVDQSFEDADRLELADEFDERFSVAVAC